jgi:hypothetical protein
MGATEMACEDVKLIEWTQDWVEKWSIAKMTKYRFYKITVL